MGTKKLNEEQARPDTAELDRIEGGTGEAVARVSTDDVALGDFGGETGDINLALPYLQVSHAMGKLDKFVKGSIILGTENLIAGPGQPVRITVLNALAYWKEYTSGSAYDPDYIPKTFKTKAEVLAAGGTTDWDNVNNKPPSFKLAIAAKVLVQQPEGIVCGLFGIPIGGKMWAPARWNTDKTAAQRCAPVLKTARTFSLRTRGLSSGIFELKTRPEVFPKATVYVPTINLVDHHTDESLALIKSMFNNDVAVPVDLADDGNPL